MVQLWIAMPAWSSSYSRYLTEWDKLLAHATNAGAL